MNFNKELYYTSTTFSAGVMNIKDNYLPMANTQGYINVALTLIMIILATIISAVSFKQWYHIIKKER